MGNTSTCGKAPRVLPGWFASESGTVRKEVLSLKGIPQLVDIFTAWIGLTLEDAPVLIRDRSVQEIYALDLQ